MKRKQRAEELVRYIEEIRDEEGYAVIDVNLSETTLYDPLSVRNKRDLNKEIYDYIDEQANVIPASVPLRVRFYGDVPEEEHEEIRAIMHRHYTLKSLDISWDMAANVRKMILLAIFGAIVLAVYFYLAYTSDQVFFAEVLSIVGSFSLWEAADSFLLERPRLRREQHNVEQNLNQRIEFHRL